MSLSTPPFEITVESPHSAPVKLQVLKTDTITSILSKLSSTTADAQQSADAQCLYFHSQRLRDYQPLHYYGITNAVPARERVFTLKRSHEYICRCHVDNAFHTAVERASFAHSQHYVAPQNFVVETAVLPPAEGAMSLMDLPDDVLNIVLTYIDPFSLLSVACVNKQLHQHIDSLDSDIWPHCTRRCFPHNALYQLNTWRDLAWELERTNRRQAAERLLDEMNFVNEEARPCLHKMVFRHMSTTSRARERDTVEGLPVFVQQQQQQDGEGLDPPKLKERKKCSVM
eukprot:TRINITY_DN8460_c0_g1_i1.p1 TRINITY_DN8460_c0_g1~~TRINITY_DN8460_c0_g1_i1.p1  ORF type:complete len:285 (-),score=46.69 TRINITY_DN8460_c0_g1_i1:358-1212(-)